MLKITVLLEKLIPKQLRVSDDEVNRFDVGSGKEIAKKSGKLSKPWKLAKLEKKLSKNGNLLNFDIIEAGSKFLTPNAKTVFNCL